MLGSTCLPRPPTACPTHLWGTPHSQHSSLTVHFSVSSVGSMHTEPSSGNCFTYLSRDLIPMPHETLQGDQVIHSDMVQVEPSVTHGTRSGGAGKNLGSVEENSDGEERHLQRVCPRLKEQPQWFRTLIPLGTPD